MGEPHKRRSYFPTSPSILDGLVLISLTSQKLKGKFEAFFLFKKDMWAERFGAEDARWW